MHSSRMRTGSSLTVCWSLLPGGGGAGTGGVWSGVGVVWECVVGGVWSGGCLLLGGLVRGFCSWRGGVCSLGGLVWGVSSLGVPAPGGVCSLGGSDQGGLVQGGLVRGLSAPRGDPSMHWSRPPLWTDRHLWKYYLGPTSLLPVIIFGIWCPALRKSWITR